MEKDAARDKRRFAQEANLRNFLNAHAKRAQLDNALTAVHFSLSRYQSTVEQRLETDTRERAGRANVKDELRMISKAARALVDALQPRMTKAEAGFGVGTNPSEIWPLLEDAFSTNESNSVLKSGVEAQNAIHLAAAWHERIGQKQNFIANVALVRDSAEEALKRLSKKGKPPSDRVRLVDELAVIWKLANGNRPTSSGETTFKTPRSHFAQFVKLSVLILPKPDEFQSGFGDLIKKAVKMFGVRNQLKN